MNKQSIVTIQRLGKYGEGVASFSGRSLFITNTIPGEEIEFTQLNKRKPYFTAKVRSIVKASQHRQDPACPEYQRCGGCQLMHANYDYQLKQKTESVLQAMKNFAAIDVENLLEECVASDEDLYYRNKIQIAVQSRAGDKIKAGLFAHNSHQIIPIERCLIHDRLGAQVLKNTLALLEAENIKGYNERKHTGYLRNIVIRTSQKQNQALVVFVTRVAKNEQLLAISRRLVASKLVAGVCQNINEKAGNTVLGPKTITLAGNGYLTESIDGLDFQFSSNSFLQINPKQCEKLYAKAIEWADIQPEETVLDIYSGIGTLTLLAAQKAKQAYGVESVDAAVINAQTNASLNSITNASFLAGKVESLIETLPHADTVFLDPPRKGCAADLLKKLPALSAKKVVYISCDPITLARDSKILLAEGYKLVKLQPFDMFPQTAHVETLALFTK